MAAAGEMAAVIKASTRTDGGSVFVDLREVTSLAPPRRGRCSRPTRRPGARMTLLVTDGPVLRLRKLCGVGGILVVLEA